MKDYVSIDIETTGISPKFNKITEIGAVRIRDGQVVATYNQLINPQATISEEITQLTGIDYEMIRNAPVFEEMVDEFLEFCQEDPIIGHNILFDFSFIKTNVLTVHKRFEKSAVDTYELATVFHKGLGSKSLTSLCEYYRIDREKAHRALHDAMATHELYQIFYQQHCNELNKRFFEPKPIYWRPQKDTPMTEKQKKYLLALIKAHQIDFQDDMNTLSKSEASKWIDKIILNQGMIQK